jgi:hypothetical protein
MHRVLTASNCHSSFSIVSLFRPFVYGLFNNAVSISDYKAPNDRMWHKRWNEMYAAKESSRLI